MRPLTVRIPSTAALAALWLLSPLADAAERIVDFDRDVRPILSENCFHCHGPDEKARKAKLRVDRKESVFGQDEDSYPLVVPGKPDESELISRIFSDDPDIVMPQPDSHRTLTAEQKNTLRRWVEQGAPWAEHWAFVAPKRAEVPAVAGLPATANPIDAFVRSRLVAEKLSPSPEASKETLIRRATLDLTGLPPTTAEVDAFLSDRKPDAYERLVDRLLASPRFGERMVWEWLDAARYADTNGYQGDPTRTMWPWRDWAMKAINDNMPYDRFTVEQIAGDLLPAPTLAQRIATGFNRNHMLNNEGGSIPEESRVNYVFDRVETTATIWLGLTVGCARCHDHKFDQFTQKEYFQLYAYFNQLPEKGNADAVPNAKPYISLAPPEDEERVAALKKIDGDLRKERVAIEEKMKPGQVAWEKAILDGSLQLPVPEPTPADRRRGTKLDPKILTPDLRAIFEKSSNDRSVEDEKVVAELFYATSDDHRVAADREFEARRETTEAERKLLRVMVMEDMPTPRATFILARGAYDQPTVKVGPGTPAILPALPDHATTDRLALAQWLVSPDNPLTSRVTVNRFWAMFFGRGIVKTVSDFGVQGDKPTHPELLDWLAREFVESGWDVKRLVRLIATSATYRQSSHVAAVQLERDPDNRWLSRAPRFRLPSWMIRDQALAAGGLLVEQVGGPPVKGYQPPGIWEEATFGKISYEQDSGDALYRRSLYQFWRRIVGPTMFFDTSSRQTCSVEATRTNTPLHALATLNDVTYVESARALAQRMLKSGGSSDERRLAHGFALCTGRQPKPEEMRTLSAALGRQRAIYSANPARAAELIANGDSKPDPSIVPTELAAHTAVALLLLNLDEVLNKE